ncbi:hypothetical protein Desor_2561 [Desulfosporosinus orientis DSM 765]|uniref:Uncharacterized protein n=1 Tax=Desulfosporosinus orientis (strain ATCC 19365 / DSM 765 / NCIMB 8382 / VKM B-1628 / Singapore I) TaxID=768706 RepID=G7W6A8_DESOD|nr:hypothetical protein [Desulfosporosinus orientis]AET68115.1 hypothetical protein Desor_2561 [Desulfosporosinus orientis DSM 765]
MGTNKCNCLKIESKDLPIVIGGIIVYELAIITVLMVLIYLDLDEPCCQGSCVKEEQSCEINAEMTD